MDYIFGWLATAGTFIYKVPQIYKLYKTKSSNDVSSTSLVIQTTGYIFYTMHGFFIDDHPTITMGFLSFAQNILLVILCCLYKSKKNKVKKCDEPYVKAIVTELRI